MTRIAILNDYQKIALQSASWDRLPDTATIDVYHDHQPDEAAVIDRLKPYDVIVGMRERTPFPRRVIEQLPNLKLLITTSVRNRSFDLDACADHGVVACHTEPGHTPTAELAWGLILALAKNIPGEDRSTREGQWGDRVGIGLAGRTLGLAGLGKLGGKIAEVGRLFDMEVIAWSQNLTDARCAELGVRRVSKDELLEQSDILSVNLVLGDRTRGLIGAAELARMKPTAYLVNTSRGPIVDEKALIDALERNVIAGAGLDVFDTEPLPADHPLRRLPNTVITPHVGGFVEENYRLWYEGAVEDILAWLDGKPIRVMPLPKA